VAGLLFETKRFMIDPTTHGNANCYNRAYPMSYGRDWLRKARDETWKFWTPKRTVSFIAAPIVAGLLWALFRPWNGWSAIMQVAVISVLGFFALWGVLFFVSLIEAPSQLDAEKSEAHTKKFEIEISLRQHAENDLEKLRASTAVTFQQQQDRRTVEKAIADFSPDDKTFLRWHAERGQVREIDHRQCGVVGWDLGKCRTRGLIHDVAPDPRSTINFTRVNPDLREAILFVIPPSE
jgi:hypothetical protein